MIVLGVFLSPILLAVGLWLGLPIGIVWFIFFRKKTKLENRKKYTVAMAVIMAISALFYASSGEEDTPKQVTQNEIIESQTEESQITEIFTEETEREEKGTFELIAGKQGQYGKKITINTGTDSEESFYVYHVPAGTYEVTNIGQYMTQVNVYEGFVKNEDTGYDEYTNTGDVKLIDVAKTDTITVPDGWFIEIQEPAKIKLLLVKTEPATEETETAQASTDEHSSEQVSSDKTTSETPQSNEVTKNTETPSDQQTSSSKLVETQKPAESEKPVENKEPVQESEKIIMVWITSTGNGKTYHNDPECSNMKNPIKVTLKEAESQGKRPCKKCY